MQSHVLLSSGQVDNVSNRQIIKCIELVWLAKINHVPYQTLLIGDLPMKFEMVITYAILTQVMVFETERVLSPFEV